MSTNGELRGFDADNHYYEAMDAFTRHIEPEYREARDAVGRDRRQDAPARRWSRQPVHPEPHLRHALEAGQPRAVLPRATTRAARACVELFGELEPTDPAYRDRDIRLKVMDDQRIDGALFFPTLGVGMEEALARRPARGACRRSASFNRWLDDDWGFHYKERIFAAPVPHAVRRRRDAWPSSSGCSTAAPAS